MPGKYKSDSRSFIALTRRVAELNRSVPGEATHENDQIYANRPTIATGRSKIRAFIALYQCRLQRRKQHSTQIVQIKRIIGAVTQGGKK